MSKKLVLVTAGNTRVPIDRVRGIDNVFKGRTGTAIAEYFADQGHDVVLLASHPELTTPRLNLEVSRFRTYSDLFASMRKRIEQQPFDIIIHSAAVSDYRPNGAYHQLGEPIFVDGVGPYYRLEELDSSGKIGSDHPVLWMRMTPTHKIIDLIRNPWGFRGTLVKFKLQVGMSDEELIEVAARSMHHSRADFIVANTLEGMTAKAFIISAQGGNPIEVSRKDLPQSLFKELGL